MVDDFKIPSPTFLILIWITVAALASGKISGLKTSIQDHVTTSFVSQVKCVISSQRARKHSTALESLLISGQRQQKHLYDPDVSELRSWFEKKARVFQRFCATCST